MKLSNVLCGVAALGALSIFLPSEAKAHVARHCSCKCATLKAGDGDGLQNVNLVHSFQGSILFFGVVLSSLFLALERVSSSMSLSDIAAA